jgi:hypothetical protein
LPYLVGVDHGEAGSLGIGGHEVGLNLSLLRVTLHKQETVEEQYLNIFVLSYVFNCGASRHKIYVLYVEKIHE